MGKGGGDGDWNTFNDINKNKVKKFKNSAILVKAHVQVALG